MGWEKSIALAAATVLGIGSLVYLYFKIKEDEDEFDENPRQKTSRHTIIEVKIPKESVGVVIGRGGSNIHNIQTRSNTKIKIVGEETDDYRRMVIRGTAESAQYAESLIHNAIINQPLIESYTMAVPSLACGRIIGKNGESIRKISQSSNAKLKIENGPIGGGSQERKIIITGTAQQISVAQALVQEKIDEDNEFRNKIQASASNRSPRHQPKYLMAGKAEPEPANSYENEKLVPTGSDGMMEVYVSAVESPSQLWLQLVGPRTVGLDKLNDEMTSYYSKDENKALHVLKEVRLNQIVAAPYPYDEKWYRAEVVGVTPNEEDPQKTELQLYYVDYGDSALVDQCDTFELRTDFLRLRFQAIECILARVKPTGSTWTEEATDTLEELAHVALWKVLMGKIHSYKERPTRTKREGSPVPCVQLYDTSGGQTIDLAEELVKGGHAEWEPDRTKSSSQPSSSQFVAKEKAVNGGGENNEEILKNGSEVEHSKSDVFLQNERQETVEG